MAKDLPYFKFFVSEWNDGDITLEDFETQGLFINLCAYYWSNECEITLKKSFKKFRHINKDCFEKLIDAEIIKVVDDVIIINFLDEQKEERIQNSIRKSKGGKASVEARRIKKSLKNEQVLNSCSTETQVLREEERREEKKREEKKRINDFNIFWDSYPSKIAKKDCLKIWHKLKQEDINKILSSINDFVNYKPWNDYKHPNPKTYLNQERWNDELKENNFNNLNKNSYEKQSNIREIRDYVSKNTPGI